MFLDLDDIWLSRQLLLVDGLAFGTKPIKLLSPQRVPQRKLLVSGSALRLNVGLVAGQEPLPVWPLGHNPSLFFGAGSYRCGLPATTASPVTGIILYG